MATSRDTVSRLRMYFVELLHSLGRYMNMRQRVVSTAVVFFKRFYLKRSFGEFDPRLAAPTILFLAAKVEETYQNAKYFRAAVERCKEVKELYSDFNLTMQAMLEFEFYVLEVMDFDLIVFHPYRPITRILEELKWNSRLKMAWSIANDSYRTDLCLEHPPTKIAVAVIYLSMVLSKDSSDKRDSFLSSVSKAGDNSADVADVMDICGRLLELYKYYSEVGKGGNLKPKDAIELLEKIKDGRSGDNPTDEKSNAPSPTEMTETVETETAETETVETETAESLSSLKSQSDRYANKPRQPRNSVHINISGKVKMEVC